MCMSTTCCYSGLVQHSGHMLCYILAEGGYGAVFEAVVGIVCIVCIVLLEMRSGLSATVAVAPTPGTSRSQQDLISS
jgi:hypothetical protein